MEFRSSCRLHCQLYVGRVSEKSSCDVLGFVRMMMRCHLKRKNVKNSSIEIASTWYIVVRGSRCKDMGHGTWDMGYNYDACKTEPSITGHFTMVTGNCMNTS